MSDLLNSNGTAPNNKPFYVLASSVFTFICLGIFRSFQKENFIKYPKIVFAVIFIASLLFTVFAVMYITAWFLVVFPPPDTDDTIKELNHNYSVSALSFLAGIPIYIAAFWVIQKFVRAQEEIDWKQILFNSILLFIGAYTLLGLSYYLNLTLEDSYSFPLKSNAILGNSVHLESQNNIGYLGGAIACLLIPAILFGLYYKQKFKINEYPRVTIIASIFFLVLSSIFFLNFTDNNIRYYTSLIPFCIILLALIGYYEMMRRPYDIYFYSVLTVFVAWSFFIVTLASLNNSNEELRNNYTFLFVILSFIMYAFLLIALFTLSYFNSYQLKQQIQYPILIGVSLGISLIFSFINSAYISEMDIKNSKNLENVTLADGTKAEDYKNSGFELLKFAIAFNYFSIFCLLLFLIIISLLLFFPGDYNKKILDLSEFILLKNKLKYDWYGFLLLVGALAIVIISIYLGVYFAADNKDAFPNKIKTLKEFINSGYLPVTVASSIIVFSYLIEVFINFSKEEKKKSSIILQILRAIIILFPLFSPIIALISYFVNEPKFLEQIISDPKTSLLVFGDSQDKNGAPFIDNEIDRSQFSVSSNFVTFGHGLFVTGGRSSLDLNTTRNIIYLDNQQNYFNSKFQYTNGIDFNPEDFQFIEKDGLNLFSLETNQISYGDNNNNTNNAFWVAVGENVGLGNNGSILYNTKAGSNGKNNIPYLDTFNDWEESNGGAFEYKGNGVVSGIHTGSNRWVAVGQNKVDFSDTLNIKYSNDGKNWSNAAGASFSNYGNKVAFAPSGLQISSGLKIAETFIAVGSDNNNNNILRSLDGQNWVPATGVCFAGTGNDVVYGMSSNGTSGVWVAVGSDSNHKPVKYSIDDGFTWQDANGTFDFTKPEDALTVAYDLGSKTFTVAGKKGSNNILYHSSNGKDWSSDTNYNNYDEITALNYNLYNLTSNPNFNKVYYPYSNVQNFFVEKVSSENLKYFMIGNYLVTIFLVLFFYFLVFRLNRDKFINSTGK